jgi:cytochrome c oxidase subunit 2
MRRVVTFGSMAVVALFALAACGDDTSRYSSLSPRSDVADDIQGIYKLIFWLALVVFIGVQFAIVYTALRYRRRKEDGTRPPQIHGNKTLEIVWTIIPAIVLLVIFIPTVRVMYDHADSAKDGDVVVEVYAKQWWWEVHYPGMGTPDKDGNATPLLTANEIHVPAGKKIQIKLYSNNVIHSFYVPQLSGKMDVMPGHENVIGFTADEPGVYYGECAEFCGDSHAWMRFQVVVEPQEQYDAWVTAMNTAPAAAAATYGTNDTGLITPPASFGLCLACHRVGGTTAQFAPVGLNQASELEGGADGPAKSAGPNLGLFGCRTTIGAGIIPNTLEDLKAWLRDPGAIKPGNYMANVVKAGTLNEQQVDEIARFLLSLVPEGGCGEITNATDSVNNSLPVGADSVPAATPGAAATPAS